MTSLRHHRPQSPQFTLPIVGITITASKALTLLFDCRVSTFNASISWRVGSTFSHFLSPENAARGLRWVPAPFFPFWQANPASFSVATHAPEWSAWSASLRFSLFPALILPSRWEQYHIFIIAVFWCLSARWYICWDVCRLHPTYVDPFCWGAGALREKIAQRRIQCCRRGWRIAMRAIIPSINLNKT